MLFAMKLNSDLRYQARFNLWLHGKDVLSALKAVETLDFLIDHLNESDGQFSASMIHQPAFAAVTSMGSAAVPKLAEALKHHSERDVRLTVALRLIEIGGDNATNALKEVAKTDSDECVRRFIELSLKESTKESLRSGL